MTLHEFKKKVAESDIKDWLQSLTIYIRNPHIDYEISLTGLVAIYDFLSKQIKIYQEYGKLPQELTNTLSYFVNARNIIIEIVNSNAQNNHRWSQVSNLITKNANNIFPSDIPETEFLIKLYQQQSIFYNAAYNYFTGNTQNISKTDFSGYLMAYEFLNKESSKIVERKDAEKKSISRIRTEFQQKVSESENDLTEYLSITKKHAEENANAIDNFREEKSTEYNKWFKEATLSFEQLNSATINKVLELENLYAEKLKLEAPAKYWNKRAEKLRTEGYWWLVALIACITIGVAILIWVLKRMADGTLIQLFENTATAIKWSVALITMISFIAYAIRVISKLTFSSFHLVRDAEEREQLTYVYLALQKEKGVDQTERHLIMQSLFSRADSGLLKDDSSPTMPGNIMDKMISK